MHPPLLRRCSTTGASWSPGPYIIEGTLGGRPFREPVLALTLESGGLALLKDRRLALGMPGSGGLAVIDEDAVINRTAAWIRGDSPWPPRRRSVPT